MTSRQQDRSRGAAPSGSSPRRSASPRQSAPVGRSGSSDQLRGPSRPERRITLTRLRRLDRTKVFLTALALALLALLAPGTVGAALLLVIVAVLIGLMIRTWPVTPTGTRTFRLVVLAALVAVAFAKVH